MKLKDILRKTLPFLTKRKLRRYKIYLKTIFHGSNLNKLAQIYECDKWGIHFYTQHYMTHFKNFRLKKVKLLEIGVGGYEYADCGGQSLRMWKRYFSFGKIYSIDIYDKSPIQEHRIQIFKGSQTDEIFLKSVFEKIGCPDIIIDDGSHVNEHVIETFKILFPSLKENGIYAIEDIQTSYWPEYGGDNEKYSVTIMNFFKDLSDGLNHKEFLLPDYKPDYYDLNIVSIHFYHNMIFIHKGKNDEKSNSVHQGKFFKINQQK